MDPDFAGAYDKGAKTEWLLEDMRLTVKNEEKKEIAKNMLHDTDDYGLIAKYTGLSIDEVKGLSKKQKVKFRK